MGCSLQGVWDVSSTGMRSLDSQREKPELKLRAEDCRNQVIEHQRAGDRAGPRPGEGSGEEPVS